MRGFLSLMVVVGGVFGWVASAVGDTPSEAGEATKTIRSLKVLTVIYRGGAGSNQWLDDAGVQGVRNAIELGRLFYFRNTRGELDLDITYLVVDADMPPNEGPTYEHIEKDLRARGIGENRYDGVYAAGRGAKGNWGGWRVLGRTGAAFGGVGPGKVLHQVPEDDPQTWYYAAWNFVHEFQHALDLSIASGSGRADLLHAHPYADRNEPYFFWGHGGAQHWDWVAYTLRTFEDWMGVTGATDSTITYVDSDGDGLADDDPRLAMDERRFGSDPTRRDSDGDGLDDLAEFTGDIYRGADPRKRDTDEDGAPDGADPHPTVALAREVAYATGVVIDGRRDASYRPLFTRVYHTNLPGLAGARIDASWNEGGLHLFVHTPERAKLYVQIDGSPSNGFWEGGDTYGVHVEPDGTVRGEWGDKDVSRAEAAWSEAGLEVFIPAAMGQGLSGEVNYGGERRSDDDATGLALRAGRSVSLNVELATSEGKALFTPNWSMFETILAGGTAAEAQ